MIQLNITSLVELSRRFVDDRRASAQDRAYLINIASIGAYQSVPNMALYAASKAFVRNFTEALHDELRGSPISATCICPGGTETGFHAAAGAGDYSWLANASMMSAQAVARITVRAMRKGKRNILPGLPTKLAAWSVRLVPRRIASWLSRRVLGKPKTAALPARSVA
jgi:short-subunit dehydrogenase